MWWLLALAALAAVLLALLRLHQYYWHSTLHGDVLFDDTQGNYSLFPDVFTSPPRVALSVILQTLTADSQALHVLHECIQYLQQREITDPNFTYEIIVIPSYHSRADITLQFTSTYGAEKIRILRSRACTSPAAALHMGMVRARGRYVLLMDHNVPIRCLHSLEIRMHEIVDKDWAYPAVVIGSPDVSYIKSTGPNSLLARLVFGSGFSSIFDLECGFRLLTRGAVLDLSPNLRSISSSFFLEMVFQCWMKQVYSSWVPVNYADIGVSEFTLSSYLFLLLTALCTRRFYPSRIGVI